VLYPSLGLLLRPEWAALAMSASTVTVTLNTLLLNLVHFPDSDPPGGGSLHALPEATASAVIVSVPLLAW